MLGSGEASGRGDRRGGREAVTLFLAEGAAMRGLAVSSGEFRGCWEGRGTAGGAGWGPGHAGSWGQAERAWQPWEVPQHGSAMVPPALAPV